MGFQQEIDEERERREAEERMLQAQLEAVRKWCAEHDTPFSEHDADRILHPEDYDDWGNHRYIRY